VWAQSQDERIKSVFSTAIVQHSINGSHLHSLDKQEMVELFQAVGIPAGPESDHLCTELQKLQLSSGQQEGYTLPVIS
jgi:hypothetical protein